MNYELTYKCINCFVKWTEVISVDVLREIFLGKKVEIMTKEWLYLLFRNGMEIHYCKIFKHAKPVDGTVSYGNVLSIRPIREE